MVDHNQLQESLSSWIPQTILLVGVICGFWVILKFNLKTKKLASLIKSLYKNERGLTWDFWGDYNNRRNIIFSPEDIFDSEDTDNIRHAKKLLIQHRRTLGRIIFMGMCCSLSGLILAVISLVIISTL